jgi:hypothetical protein
MASKLREQWQKVRDAAGFKQGYTKTSLGDVIDQWAAARKAALGKKAYINCKKEDYKKCLDAAIKAFAAAHEYVEKVHKEKGVTTLPCNLNGEKFDIPYYEYSIANLRANGEEKTPLKTLFAFLNEIRFMTYHVIHFGDGETALLKACPDAQNYIAWQRDGSKGIAEMALDLTRERWKGHRDGAGIKQGYTKASIGDLIDKWDKVVGTKWQQTGTLSVDQRKAAAAVAEEVFAAAEEYIRKLRKENKKVDTPAVKMVIEDLNGMSHRAQQVLKTVADLETQE